MELVEGNSAINIVGARESEIGLMDQKKWTSASH